MEDRYRHHADSPMAPASTAFAITPSDSTDLSHVSKAIYVGEGGDLTVRMLAGGADVRFANLPAGAILDVRATAVKATGTTAGSLVGLA